MRNTAFLMVGLALLILQSNLHWLLDRLHPGLATPSLLLPLVLFMGVHEYSVARGVALSFLLGYFLDLFAAAPIGLFTFVNVSIFLVARLAGVRLSAQTLLTKVALVFAFALVESVLVIVLTAILGNDPYRPRALAALVPAHTLSTALVAPLVFRFAERVHFATIGAPTPPEGSGRS